MEELLSVWLVGSLMLFNLSIHVRHVWICEQNVTVVHSAFHQQNLSLKVMSPKLCHQHHQDLPWAGKEIGIGGQHPYQEWFEASKFTPRTNSVFIASPFLSEWAQLAQAEFILLFLHLVFLVQGLFSALWCTKQGCAKGLKGGSQADQ